MGAEGAVVVIREKSGPGGEEEANSGYVFRVEPTGFADELGGGSGRKRGIRGTPGFLA